MNIDAFPQLEIVPVNGPLKGRVVLPGSKSLTNRAFLVAALAKGDSRLSGVLSSDDTVYMAAALRDMGVGIDSEDETTLTVRSSGKLKAPAKPLFLGNAGTATRFLTAAVALADGEVVVDGDEHMRKRPIGPLVEALTRLGVEVSAPTGCPPVTVRARGGFSGDVVEIDANLSSQYVSALLILAACGEKPVEVRLRGDQAIGGRGYIDLTTRCMEAFGAKVSMPQPGVWRVEPTGYAAADYLVEPDASSCTYLWAAEVLTAGEITFQMDTTALTQPDAKSRDVIMTWPNMPAVIDGSQMQDAVPTLAVLAAFNNTPVRFVGIANLRVKECDRVSALSQGLNAIREGLAHEEGDDLIVHADPGLIGATTKAVIDTHNDHRIAMCFALAGLMMSGVVIDNPKCVSKTFPGYWDVLESLGVGLKLPVL
ncbi:3-phosphoshikimate 1-carboxyvinyltransferase [Asticcacaulis sp. YBE204]|uniref:3-phosphoshikimate 1-carboxyvinyltransferase n=1 Tax=Asticcacaulis sp. YBE204 TaxID=1282363 RepID=UPI0003C3FCA4|nr:3-phosphoshikimate 1-carboxyvinyltransferase [Asticcacaulis sp. YBE204]ESQ79635.1 3-phosphoshikimate 1-carboxyvinyltransferase [Asticcacaulis sp. YBE204]